jgi:hypothetical protein
MDWSQRCNHIAQHFEKGFTLKKWHHTDVILALLRQPGVAQAWDNLIARKGKAMPHFHFRPKTTGRAEGYPYTRRAPQLQDLLEFFTPGQDADKLVERAWEEGYRTPEPITSHLNKDLPPLPPVHERENPSLNVANHHAQELLVAPPIGFHVADEDLMDTNFSTSHEHELKSFVAHGDTSMAYFGEPLRENWHPMASTVVPDELLADTSFMDSNLLDPNFGNLWADNYAFYAQGN